MHMVAAQLGISDTGLAKLCKRTGVPSPYRGYWRQMRTGNAPSIPPLPDSENEYSVVLPPKMTPVPPKRKKASGDAGPSTATSRRVPSGVTRSRVSSQGHEDEYQKLIGYSQRLADYNQVSRVLSELSMRLPGEADQVAAVAARWMDLMRGEHSKRNPVDVLMAELREMAAGRNNPP